MAGMEIFKCVREEICAQLHNNEVFMHSENNKIEGSANIPTYL